jgi:hypothetical protein
MFPRVSRAIRRLRRFSGLSRVQIDWCDVLRSISIRLKPLQSEVHHNFQVLRLR